MRQLGVLLGSVAVAFAGAVNTSDAAIIWDPSGPSVGYTLAEINQAGGLVVLDKTFSDFDVFHLPAAGGPFPNLDLIGIRPSLTSDGDVRVDFFGGWALWTGDLVNTNLSFKLTTADPWLLEGVKLGLVSYYASFNGSISIAENIYSSSDFVPENQITNFGVNYKAGDPANTLQNSGTFDPTNEVWIVKDITISGGTIDEPGHAHLSRFYQVYYQIPEPATLTVMGLGGLLMLRRRRA